MNARRRFARARTRVAAYGLCRDDHGRVLLCRIVERIASDETWTLPGGGLEFGESPGEAVLRELTEETGLTGEVVDLIDVADRLWERRFDRLHAIQIVYRLRITGGELRDEVDGSTDTCAWLPVEAALGLNLGALTRRIVEQDVAERAGRSGRSVDGATLVETRHA